MEKQPVIIIQDGAVDELMSVALVETMSNMDLIGIGVVNADCLAEPTVEVTDKILHLMKVTGVPVTQSTARGVNAFPWIYRQYCLMSNLLPMLNTDGFKPVISSETTEEMLVRLVNENTAAGKLKVKIVVLSPLTPLVTAWETDPGIKNGIEEIIWMGGALPPVGDNCGFPYGNVDPGIVPGANANAEWNAYWDPFAVENVLASGVKLTMFPLNATNDVMLSSDIVLKFAPESATYPLYALAGQLYSMVAFEAGYAFWDTVTTAYIDRPDLYTISQKQLLNITTGSDQGNIYESDNGYSVNVVTDVKVNAFYDYIFEQWKMLT